MSARQIRNGLLLILLAAGCSMVAFAGRPTIFPKTPKPQIHWRVDLDKAHEEALKTNKPLLVVFDAEWCSYCRRMDQTTFTDAGIATYVNNTFVPVQLKLEDHYRTAEILEIDRVPATVALSPNADLIGRIVGFVNVETYRESLGKIRVLNQRLNELPNRSR